LRQTRISIAPASPASFSERARDPQERVDDPILLFLQLLRPAAVAQSIPLNLYVEHPFEALGFRGCETAGETRNAVHPTPLPHAPGRHDLDAGDPRKELDDHLLHLGIFPSKTQATLEIPVV